MSGFLVKFLGWPQIRRLRRNESATSSIDGYLRNGCYNGQRKSAVSGGNVSDILLITHISLYFSLSLALVECEY